MVVVEKSGGKALESANPQSSSGTTREMLHRVNFFSVFFFPLIFCCCGFFLAFFTVLAVQHSDIMVGMMAQFVGQKAPMLCFVGDTSEP